MKNILAATDFSPVSDNALLYAANLAKEFLEHVFKRNQAEHMPVFVDHDRHLKPIAAHLIE